jgi:hypothetical protein
MPIHRHAVQGAPGSRCVLVRLFGWAWASGAVEPLLPLQTACVLVLGMIGL